MNDFKLIIVKLTRRNKMQKVRRGWDSNPRGQCPMD